MQSLRKILAGSQAKSQPIWLEEMTSM